MIGGELGTVVIEEHRSVSLGMSLGLFAALSERFVVEDEAVASRADGPAEDVGAEGGLVEQEDE